MRVSPFVITVLAIATLSGCTALSDAVPGASGIAGADDAAAKVAVNAAKVALNAYFVANPSELTVTSDQLVPYGLNASGPAISLHVTTPQVFCIDVTSATGAIFKTTARGSVVDGTCTAGTDF